MQPTPEQNKLYDNLSDVPLLPGHQTIMVMGDDAMLQRWDELIADPAAMQEAHTELAGRLHEFFKQEQLLDEVSGVAPTDVNCVWLNCSLRAWERARTELGLQAWSNSQFGPFSDGGPVAF